MITDDRFAQRLRNGDITPEEGLTMLQQDKVLVYPDPAAGIDRETALWDEIEGIGAGSSGIPQALYEAGGQDLAMDYSTEIARLREEGHVLTF